MTVEMFSNENFKPIKGWEGYYISNKGTVISYRNKRGGINNDKFRVLKQELSNRNYYRVTLYIKDIGRYRVSVHRLIAETFIPNFNNYPCVNHKDENTLNNCVENLEWCSYSYNNTYNDKNIKIGNKLKGIHTYRPAPISHKPKKVICVDTGIIYNSLADAAAAYGSKKTSSRIADVCNGKYKQAFGFKWCWYGSAIS